MAQRFGKASKVVKYPLLHH